jgi:hypothetical protein
MLCVYFLQSIPIELETSIQTVKTETSKSKQLTPVVSMPLQLIHRNTERIIYRSLQGKQSS